MDEMIDREKYNNYLAAKSLMAQYGNIVVDEGKFRALLARLEAAEVRVKELEADLKAAKSTAKLLSSHITDLEDEYS